MKAVNQSSVVPASEPTRPQAAMRLLDRIGNTPLLRLERIVAAFPNIEFYAKAEWFNPGGSVKDRPARFDDS